MVFVLHYIKRIVILFAIKTHRRITMKRFSLNSNYTLLFFTIFGIFTPMLGISALITFADIIGTVFIKTLKTISLPILFLSLCSTLSSMKNLDEMKILGRKIFFYTFLTTLLAALVALCAFIYISSSIVPSSDLGVLEAAKQHDYSSIFIQLFPANFVKPFVEGNAFGVVLIAFALGVSSQFLPEEKKDMLNKGFDALFSLFLIIAKAITFILPVASWAFMTKLALQVQMSSFSTLKTLSFFLIAIVSVNLFQAFVILPLLLLKNKISPRGLFQETSKALSVAFFTKSSSASLPFSLDLITKNSSVSKKVASFSLPLCSTINMNGCAQFILLSVLFSHSYMGISQTPFGFLFWVFLAVFAAIGNAGVPMGCYFLASLLLTSANIPLVFMGLILPFYPILDMIETAVNIWSDICITKISDKQLKQESPEIVF